MAKNERTLSRKGDLRLELVGEMMGRDGITDKERRLELKMER